MSWLALALLCAFLIGVGPALVWTQHLLWRRRQRKRIDAMFQAFGLQAGVKRD